MSEVISGMKYPPVISRPNFLSGRQQHVFRFPNDYGASVIEKDGKWNLAVIRFGDDGTNTHWQMSYNTGMIPGKESGRESASIDGLDWGQVEYFLDKISALEDRWWTHQLLDACEPEYPKTEIHDIFDDEDCGYEDCGSCEGPTDCARGD